MMLMNSRNQAHVFHLSTKSYAQHKALQKYYGLTETGKLFLNELNTTWSELQNAVNLVTNTKKKH